MEKFFATLVQISMRCGMLDLSDQQPPTPTPPPLKPRVIKVAHRRLKPNMESIVSADPQQEPVEPEEETPSVPESYNVLCNTDSSEPPSPETMTRKDKKKLKKKQRLAKKKEAEKLAKQEMTKPIQLKIHYRFAPDDDEEVEKEIYLLADGTLSGPFNEIPSQEEFDYARNTLYHVIRLDLLDGNPNILSHVAQIKTF